MTSAAVGTSMLARLSERLLMGPDDIEASQDDLEVVGTFNPGAIRVGDEVVLLVRVVERPREQRPGFTGLPRWDPDAGLIIDWVPDAELEPIDIRLVRRRADGLIRLTFISHLRVVRCGDGRAVTAVTTTRFTPDSMMEEYGVEDPRITTLDGRHYFTYVAVSRHGAATALASTEDFQTFERHGIIFCPENKDVVLFPERVKGEYVALHRPNGATPFTRPEMWLATSPDLLHWGGHQAMPGVGSPWATGRVGAGPPPIRVADGWLEIVHGNLYPAMPGEVGMYAGAAILLDADDPARIVRRTPAPFFTPTAAFERHGFVPDVVFPTGIVEDGGELLVYYGAADAYTAVVAFDREQMLAACYG